MTVSTCSMILLPRASMIYPWENGMRNLTLDAMLKIFLFTKQLIKSISSPSASLSPAISVNITSCSLSCWKCGMNVYDWYRECPILNSLFMPSFSILSLNSSVQSITSSVLFIFLPFGPYFISTISVYYRLSGP
jgi:hypothetical protein